MREAGQWTASLSARMPRINQSTGRVEYDDTLANFKYSDMVNFIKTHRKVFEHGNMYGYDEINYVKQKENGNIVCNIVRYAVYTKYENCCGSDVGFVDSTERTAYPDDGEQEENWYKFIGIQ